MSRNILGYECRLDITGVRRLADDCRGVAAIEFAFILPILLIAFFGLVEAGRAIQLDRKFDMVTSMMSDLVARQENFGTSPADRDAILQSMTDAIQHIMLPYNPNRLRLAVIPVERPTNGDPPRIYSEPYLHNGHPFNSAKCDDFANANAGSTTVNIASLVPPGGRIIVVQSQYDFQPIFVAEVLGMQLFTDANSTWEDFSVHSPRHNCNDFDNNNCQSGC